MLVISISGRVVVVIFIAYKHVTCKQCDEDDELTCDGKLYVTKSPLTCPLHALAYEIECDERASHAHDHDLIHPILGRGHSNVPEASHNVLDRFRSKNLHLHRLHYITSTNLGLCQSNMTWLTGKRGIQYHWLLDLFHRLRLPLFDGMEEALKKANEERAKKLEKIKTDEYKKMKRKREIEQEVRKQWLQEQETSHGYGDNDELDVESHNDDRSASDLMSQTTVTGVDASVVTNKKKCKCGSTIHLRTSHSDCPLRKNKQVSGETSKAASVVLVNIYLQAIMTVLLINVSNFVYSFHIVYDGNYIVKT